MRKLKKILAGFLAINLTINATSTGIVNARASESYSSEDGYETYAEESVQTYAEETVSPEPAISETDAVYYSSDTVTEMQDTGAVSGEMDTTALETTAAEQTPGENAISSESTVGTEIGTVETPEINNTTEIDDGAESTNTVELTSDSAAESSTEEISLEEIESEEETTEEESTEEEKEETEEVDLFTTDGYLNVNAFKNYTESNNTVEIQGNGKDAAYQLILLSNCDPTQLKDINIIISVAGELDITKTSNIPIGTDLGNILKSVSSMSNSALIESSTDAVDSDNEAVDNSTTEVIAQKEYSFQGIGTLDIPFCGTITASSLTALKVDNTFFGGVSSMATTSVSSSKLQITWCGTGDIPMIAKVYQFDDEKTEGHELPITVKGDSSGVMGSLIDVVQTGASVTKSQVLNVGNVVDYSNAQAVQVNSSTGNAGLICNMLTSGEICLNGYQFPTKAASIELGAEYEETKASAAGNAGGVIGVMETNTALSIQSNVALSSGIEVNANGNVGGLVGLMQQNSRITTGENLTIELEKINATGGAAAGGIVGRAENVVFADSDLQSVIIVEKPTVTGNKSNAKVGGFIGTYVLQEANLADVSTSLQLPNQIVIDTPMLTVSQNGTGTVGGYFGLLDLEGTLSYTIGNTNVDETPQITPRYEGCNAEASGAIAGQMISSDIASTLVIQNMNVNVTNNSGSGIKYHGGLVGEVGEANTDGKAVYLEISNVDIKVVNPLSNGDEAKYGFGGIAGLLAQGSILKIKDTVTVATPDSQGNDFGTPINQGGGLVGYAEKSVINIADTTDLSKTSYERGKGQKAQTGWLVGKQESALIFANGDGNGNGWKYIRGKENNVAKQAMNDIGNYGQIIRLKSGESKSQLSNKLIEIDSNHNITYNLATTINVNSDPIEINLVDAFALLSIAWNTRGYFGGVTGITSDNFDQISLRSKNIKLNDNIDLTGSGITGLSRDSYDGSKDGRRDTYIGTFDGNGKIIKLAIGETFGFKLQEDGTVVLASDGDDGYGEVISGGAYYHGRQGLFAAVGNKAVIQNLTIDGSISISNAGGDILAGGIAGEIQDDANHNITIKNVTVEEIITADCTKSQLLMVGGFLGGSYGSQNELTLAGGDNENERNVASAIIKLENCERNNGIQFNAGEIIGEVGESAFTLNANCVTVSGSITTDAQDRAYVGGLIGVIKGDDPVNKVEFHKINVNDVIFDGFLLKAEHATEICGGLFGSIWDNAKVCFTGTGETIGGLNVKNTIINAPEAKYVGGLAYRSSGKWEINNYGINLASLTINAKKDVGLLVCRGESATDMIAKDPEPRYHGALYLSTTQYWGTSYWIDSNNVNITTSNAGVFDEFVAYTTSESTTSAESEELTAKNIIENNINGVISIATEKNTEGVRVGVNTDNKCTTYQNRTIYGTSHKTNPYSRYYYDLDQCCTDSKTSNNKIDTAQELLLWSVYKYACENIKKYFAANQDITTKLEDTPWIIEADATTNGGKLDMSKYSYYPIKCNDGSITIRNSEIIFNNEQIENTETKELNKSTQGNTIGDHTQHYMIHCGLFLTYQSESGTLTVNNVTFSGSIGKVNNDTSGVLISDFVTGYFETTAKITTINLTKIIFSGLKVVDCNEGYAPLLINNIGNLGTNPNYGYVTLNIDDVQVTGYTPGTPVASSLIGSVGSTQAKQINMTFQKIVLPDKRADGTENGGIFSHATLLESFTYHKDDNASGGMYNFYSTEDWSGETHKHEVTYGKEITHTNEYPDLQKWYYDEATYMAKEGLVYDSLTNKENFDSSGYLPYVYAEYNSENCTHEIKVNQRVVDIINGCGTYGHPYRITKKEEMNILSDYMATGEPRKDWRVTITKSQDQVHVATDENKYTSTGDVTYQYDGNGNWVQVENKSTDEKDDWQEVEDGNTLPKEFMLDYLLNAYYDIRGTADQKNATTTTTDAEETSTAEPQLILTNFKGFGTKVNPFRGVITSGNNTNVILKGNETGNGLIPYSYGSVVKNLKISYAFDDEPNASKVLTNNSTATNTNATYYPDVCFGGVIGCVLGGDNIIDNVTVSIANNWLTLSGDKKHLIQVGGYVGSISGGGVIFRNMEGKDGLTNNAISNESTDISVNDASVYYSLYVNPYVGRVLDGFAFCEAKTSGTVLQNTNKNYEINTIVTGKIDDATDNDNTVTIKEAQGLLILSAIVNSGAGSNGISNAYSRMGMSAEHAVRYTTSDNTTTYSFGGRYGKVRNASYKDIGKDANSTDALLSITEDKNLPGSGNFPYLIQEYCDGTATQSKVFRISTNSEIEIVLKEASGFDMTSYGNGYQGIGARYVSSAVQGRVDGEQNTANHPEGVIPELSSFNGNNNTVTMSVQVSEYTDDDFHAASIGGIFNILQVSQNGRVSNLIINQNAAEVKTSPGVSLKYYESTGAPISGATSTFYRAKDVGVGVFAGSLVGYTAKNENRDITIENIQLGNLIVESPASAGGILGNTGKPVGLDEDHDEKIGKINKTSDIAALLQPEDSQIAYGIAFNECSYADIRITGKYAAGGFAGYIGNKDQNPRSSVIGFKSKLEGEEAKAGKNSTISATENSSWAGGLFGYVETRMFINMTDEGEEKDSLVILEGVEVSAGTAVGGCIGYIDGKCYGIHNVTVQGTIQKKKIVSNPMLTGKFYSGGIVGYAKGTVQGWTPKWTYAGGFSKCTVSGVEINKSTYADDHDYSGANAIQTNYMAGGIVGCVEGGKTKIETCTVNASSVYGSVAGGITGQTDSEMQFINCTVIGTSEGAKTELKGFSTAGGILGFWTGKNAATIQNSKLQYLEIQGKDWGVGAWIGDADGGGVGTLYLFNSFAQDCKVTANESKGGRWPCVGGIIGNLRNTIKASNILFSNVTLDSSKGDDTKGLLFGSVTSDGIAVNIAGISIQNIPDSNKGWNLTGSGSVSTNNDYIAFADYSGNALNKLNRTTSQETESKKLLFVGSEEVAPYVTTSPTSTFSVSDGSTDNFLYGDGANWTSSTADNKTTFTVEAQEIWKNRKEVIDGRYAYKNIYIPPVGTEKEGNFDFTSVISTYNENQTNKASVDFPVVQISSGNTDRIIEYLDILTNGGFSAVNNTANKEHVTVDVTAYNYSDGKFVEAKNSDGTSITPALKYTTNKTTGKITFSTTTDYDNDRDRFTLLTVTFTEKDAENQEYKYNVFVPVLVRRMLEIDFTATLTYGTNFKSSNYDNLSTHVLESFGTSITGYLTYTYNSELGVYTDYGWQSYINAGGNVMDMKKSIKFSADNKLPKGTQLTLVDAKSKKAYYYSVTGSEIVDGNTVIPLSSFKASDDQVYQEPSISELINATVSMEGSDKTFVKVDENGKPDESDEGKQYPQPTVRIKNEQTREYEYYRLADSSLGESGSYAIKVNESALKDKNNDSTITENYYLVITVPQNNEINALNGSIQTVVESKVPHKVNYRLRNEKEEDKHSNTASTYVLSEGYGQELKESSSINTLYKKVSASDSNLQVDVIDTITFSNKQYYNESDELYFRLVGSLQKTISGQTTAEQFPSGTTGTAEFFVYDANNKYYKYVNGAWTEGNSGEVAISYPWTSDGGNMELPLGIKIEGKDEIEPISLQGVRSSVKGSNINGKSTFFVEVKMTATIPASGLSVIPESGVTNGVPQDYTKLAYTSQLSTVSESLTYSSTRALCLSTTTDYYREEPTGVKLVYEADEIGQLGINLLDLQYLDVSREHSLIDTTAVYDLSSMKNLDATLNESKGIKFTLVLMPKNTETNTNMESYQKATTDAKNYLDIELISANPPKVEYDSKTGTWSWIIPQSEYWENGNVKTDSVFDGSILTQAIQLKINVKNVNHYYSNYKVVLTAEILDSKGNSIESTELNDNIIYTFAKIKTEFVE